MPNKRTRSKRRVKYISKGGAVLPSEFFGNNSGRYSINNSNVQNKSAYGPVKSQSYGVVNADNTTGPKNLGPYPNAVSQTGGLRKNRLRKNRCRYHQCGKGLMDKLKKFIGEEPKVEVEPKRKPFLDRFSHLFSDNEPRDDDTYASVISPVGGKRNKKLRKRVVSKRKRNNKKKTLRSKHRK